MNKPGSYGEQNGNKFNPEAEAAAPEDPMAHLMRDRSKPLPAQLEPGDMEKFRAEIARRRVANASISRDTPRDTAKLLIARKGYLVEGVSRLRYQNGSFWLWDRGCYRRQIDDEIRKVVADFLYEGKASKDGGRRAPFNPKSYDKNQVLDALKDEVLLEQQYQAPCWLPGGESAEEWIAFRNVLVNAKTLETRPLTHRLWVHTALDFDWSGPEAECPNFDEFLESILPNDEESQSTLWEWMGYCMTPDISAEKAMMFHGPPRSGKGTVLYIMEQLVGGAAGYVPLSLDTLAKSELSPHRMINMRVIAFPDERLKEGQVYGRNYVPGGLGHEVAKLLLQIIGGDEQNYRYSREEHGWQGRIKGKITIASNKILNFNDPVLPSRFIKILFGISFLGREDWTLKERLRTELPGIAAKCLVAYGRLKERGKFIQPASGLELDADLLQASDPFSQMAAECFMLEDGASISKQEAYGAFESWCNKWGHLALKRKVPDRKFPERLRAVPGFENLEEYRPNGQPRRYLGMRLRRRSEDET
jgi:putative DNA primase/helicase